MEVYRPEESKEEVAVFEVKDTASGAVTGMRAAKSSEF